MANSWFNYVSGANNTPQSYSSAQMRPECPGNVQLCAIHAETQLISGFPRPIITPALQSEISNALNSGNDSTNVLLKAE